MARTITIPAVTFDFPVNLQATQEADAKWNGQMIDLSFNVLIDGRVEMLRTPISAEQAKSFLKRLQAALDRAGPE